MLKAIKIIALIVIALILLALLLRPLIRHEILKNHWVKFPSIIPTENWKPFSSSEGKFSILFPGTPEGTNLLLNFSTTNLEMHVYYVNSNPENTFAIGYGDNPIFEKTAIAQNPEDFFNKAEAIVDSSEMARITFQKQMKFGDLPAWEFEYAAGGKANYSVRVKWILAGERIYQIYVVFLTANPHSLDEQTFFNSFRLQN